MITMKRSADDTFLACKLPVRESTVIPAPHIQLIPFTVSANVRGSQLMSTLFNEFGASMVMVRSPPNVFRSSYLIRLPHSSTWVKYKPWLRRPSKLSFVIPSTASRAGRSKQKTISTMEHCSNSRSPLTDKRAQLSSTGQKQDLRPWGISMSLSPSHMLQSYVSLA